MARISMAEYAELDAEGKKLYDGQVNAHGRITNMKRTLLRSKLAFKVYMEWYDMRDEVAKFLGDFATNVFSHAISQENSCLICSTYFRKILIEAGKNPDSLDLDETEALVAEYGRALVSNPHSIDEALFDRLKARFTEEQIVLLTAFGGMMIATNLINNALDVTPDNYLKDCMKK
jgi:hypothetical protein